MRYASVTRRAISRVSRPSPLRATASEICTALRFMSVVQCAKCSDNTVYKVKYYSMPIANAANVMEAQPVSQANCSHWEKQFSDGLPACVAVWQRSASNYLRNLP